MQKNFDEGYRLNEMGVVCKPSDGYGISIIVFSEDHGILESKTNPAHAHVKTAQGKYLGKFVITHQPPRSVEYVFDVDKKSPLPSSIKSIIAKWAKEKNKEGNANWSGLRTTWRVLHP